MVTREHDQSDERTKAILAIKILLFSASLMPVVVGLSMMLSCFDGESCVFIALFVAPT